MEKEEIPILLKWREYDKCLIDKIRFSSKLNVIKIMGGKLNGKVKMRILWKLYETPLPNQIDMESGIFNCRNSKAVSLASTPFTEILI